MVTCEGEGVGGREAHHRFCERQSGRGKCHFTGPPRWPHCVNFVSPSQSQEADKEAKEAVSKADEAEKAAKKLRDVGAFAHPELGK